MTTGAQFAHLHVHSTYSLLDGAIRIKDLVKRADALGMSSVAITDHGNLFGALEFYCAARDVGVKPIIGYEAYVAPGSRHDRKTDSTGETSYHLLLLAKDARGYKNLVKLASKAYLEGYYYRARVDKEILAEHHEGLVCMSACLGGEINRRLLREDYEGARRVAGEYQDMFGKDNFFIEVMDHGLEEQRRIAEGLKRLATEIDAKLVGTNDCHFLHADDAIAQDALVCINTAKLLSDTNRLKFDSSDMFFKDGAEMQRALKDYPDAARNTLHVAEMCQVEVELDVTHAPVFHQEGVEDNVAFLRQLCQEGMQRRFANPTQEAGDRLERELGIIERMGYVDYFLTVWDFVHYAREQGIPVGPGRGSGCGSMAGFCLGINDIDPIKHEIVFERFLDEARQEPPDIDIDFSPDGRDKVIDYVREKYGSEHVAQIITFGTLGAKAAIRDVGRVLDVPLAKVDEVAKLVPDGVKVTLANAFEQSREMREMRRTDGDASRIFDIAERVEGLARNASKHAGGVVLADRPLTDYVPLAIVKDDVATQFSMKWVAKAGLLKFDFLGLRTLATIAKTIDNIKETRGEDLDLDRIPLDDGKTFELLSRGETAGVFQCEKSGFRELMARLEPDRFEDLIVMVALYRPGPLAGGLVDQFIECKHGRAAPEYALPEMEEILKGTYGVMVYQDQVMRILHAIADFPMNEALTLIKAISKKDRAYMDAQKKVFLERTAARGVDRRTAQALYDQILAFAGYGFNKAHSTAYGLIAYQTGYLKANYPVEFMAALLTCEMINSDKTAEYVEECRRMGITVLVPDVQESDEAFTVDGDAIRFGLGGIKGIGHKAIEAILDARAETGPFRSLGHVCEHVDLKAVNRSVVEALIKSGAMDRIGGSRAGLLAGLDDCLSAGSTLQSDRRKGQGNLFAVLEADSGIRHAETSLPDIPEWSDSQKLTFERETLGLYMTSHPLARCEEQIQRFATSTIDSLSELSDGSEVTIGVWIQSVRYTAPKKGQAAGERMATVAVEDLTGACTGVIFPDDFKQYGRLIEPHRAVFLTGAVDLGRQGPNIKISRVVDMENAACELASGIRVTVPCDDMTDDALVDLSSLLRAAPGKIPVVMVFDEGRGRSTVYRVSDTIRVRPDRAFLICVEGIVGKGNVAILGNGGTAADRQEEASPAKEAVHSAGASNV